ncbi:hypothetical protein [Acinetobacter baumannii]|uniref:hypothetical protein n=1 Tax=Acinetobacter baumannii TaxID=470 RepID=UPI0005AB47B7|nr:hypothetical protein [Acinetobacter baumannii]MBF6739440.1 hypothetical protein [Acinetobacter baumannii]MBF6823846.1 hypothetical protein [Acinetobacter baumannii]MCL8259269.1 hypothetical protein [Acinetobacter baumannii]HAV2815966.1 hypothetical protein [Acinetobacter baumannii]HAV3457724.1 hypothetical protein [Acinetobacter baumannii]
MDKFEEAWKQNRHVWESTKNLAKAMYIAGEQSQQAKVEEANAKAQMCRDEKNHEINRWSAVCKERDELQKRVDSLTQTMEELLEEMKYPTATYEEVIVCGVGLLEQALKVGEN